MSPNLVLAPVFALVALTLSLLIWLGGARFFAIRAGVVRAKNVVLGQPAWPDRITQVDRAYHNQLELPLVFYALVALVLTRQAQTETFLALEWLFVALRFAHAFVHVTSNHLLLRFLLFLAGALTLAAMWIWFAAQLFG